MTLEGDNSIEIAPGIFLPGRAIRFIFARSSGPGGQNVNKLNTKATLIIPLDELAEVLPFYARRKLERIAGRYLTQTELHISDGQSRSQIANRKACMTRLREVLIEAMQRPRPRIKTKPSKGAIQRRLDSKKRRSKIKANRRGGAD